MSQSPFPELRFTHNRSAGIWLFWGIFLLCLSGISCVLALRFWGNLTNQHSLIIFIPPLLIAVICFFLSYKRIKHAFIILSKIGIELLPLSKKSTDMIVIHWGEIKNAEFFPDKKIIRLILNDEAYFDIKLGSLNQTQRKLLSHAILTRMTN